MVQLIIGLVTTDSVKIWVRPDNAALATTADITINPVASQAMMKSNISLSPDRYPTATVQFEILLPDSQNRCLVEFNNGTR